MWALPLPNCEMGEAPDPVPPGISRYGPQNPCILGLFHKAVTILSQGIAIGRGVPTSTPASQVLQMEMRPPRYPKWTACVHFRCLIMGSQDPKLAGDVPREPPRVPSGPRVTFGASVTTLTHFG